MAGKVIHKCMENEKRDWDFSSTATFLKFGQYNLFPSILTLLFINCSEFIFEVNCLPSDSHTNTVNLGPTCRSTQNATRGAFCVSRIGGGGRRYQLALLSLNEFCKNAVVSYSKFSRLKKPCKTPNRFESQSNARGHFFLWYSIKLLIFPFKFNLGCSLYTPHKTFDSSLLNLTLDALSTAFVFLTGKKKDSVMR